jgi:hypothetical protein
MIDLVLNLFRMILAEIIDVAGRWAIRRALTSVGIR